MSKKPWNISAAECHIASRGGRGSARFSAALFPLLLVLLCLLLSSCAVKKEVVIPQHEGADLEKVLADLRQVQVLNAALSVDYEKGDTIMSGDAALTLSSDELSLRIYYLGFLAGEIKEDKGEVKSKPKLDKTRSAMLVNGLRNGFFWWNIKGYTITEDEQQYVVRNSDREILVDKKSMLPTQQIIRMQGGDELVITYDMPARIEEADRMPGSPSWMHFYQSQMKIELKRYLVTVSVKSYALK
ncbi:MAG TPA: hypothetical protein VK445_07450 [Dissulfurispiraceae bacterium]|nr:hypothetical protein [Dissulfurispiraceae bacterium]